MGSRVGPLHVGHVGFHRLIIRTVQQPNRGNAARHLGKHGLVHWHLALQGPAILSGPTQSPRSDARVVRRSVVVTLLVGVPCLIHLHLRPLSLVGLGVVLAVGMHHVQVSG